MWSARFQSHMNHVSVVTRASVRRVDSAIHWITQLVLLVFIPCIMIYPVDSAFHLLNNEAITAPFNNMRTLCKCSAAPPSFRLCWVNLGSVMWFDYCALDSSRKLGEAAAYWIDGSEKRICLLTFEFKSPHVIERRNNRKSSLIWN